MSFCFYPVYTSIICIVFQGLVTLGSNLTPNVYYLDKLCSENNNSVNLQVTGHGVIYLSSSEFSLTQEGCSVILDNLVKAGYWDIELENIHLLSEYDTFRIRGNSENRIYYDHTDCSAQVPSTSTTGPQQDSRRDANNGTPGKNKIRKRPLAQDDPPSLSPTQRDSTHAPYPCDGQLARMQDEFIEIIIKEAATSSLDGKEKANFTIHFNADVNCSKTSEFKCTEIRQCVNYFSRCDETKNCVDGSDEQDCTNYSRCQPDFLPCPGGDHCIASSDRCDGYGDCKGGTDEIDCLSIHLNLMKSPIVIASIFFGIISIVLIATLLSYKLYRQRIQRQIERYRHVQMEDLHEIVNRRDSDVSTPQDHQDDNLELYSI